MNETPQRGTLYGTLNIYRKELPNYENLVRGWRVGGVGKHDLSCEENVRNLPIAGVVKSKQIIMVY